MSKIEREELINFCCAMAFKRDANGELKTNPRKVVNAMSLLLDSFEQRTQDHPRLLPEYQRTLRTGT